MQYTAFYKPKDGIPHPAGIPPINKAYTAVFFPTSVCRFCQAYGLSSTHVSNKNIQINTPHKEKRRDRAHMLRHIL